MTVKNKLEAQQVCVQTMAVARNGRRVAVTSEPCQTFCGLSMVTTRDARGMVMENKLETQLVCLMDMIGHKQMHQSPCSVQKQKKVKTKMRSSSSFGKLMSTVMTCIPSAMGHHVWSTKQVLIAAIIALL